MERFPVELAAPDLSRWAAGNSGIPYVHSFEAVRPGPHVLVSALVHGNEICGAIVLDQLLDEAIRPRCGRLSFAFVNMEAYGRFNPAKPAASRFVTEDFNRLWSPARLDAPDDPPDNPGRAGDEDHVELRRARALRRLIETVDLLLDLHSLQQPCAPLILAGPLDKGIDLAQRVGFPSVVVADTGHAAGTRMRDYGAFSDPASERNALLVECGQHWARGTERVALETTLRFLLATGAIEADLAARFGADGPTAPQSVIQVTEAVTVVNADFAFAEPYRGLEVIARAGTEIARDGGLPIRTPYDDCILIMPSLRLSPGQTAVRLGRRVAGPPDYVRRRAT